MCGSGGRRAQWPAEAGAPVRVTLPGGELFISWEEGGDVQMTGPAETVFEGELQYS